MTIDFSTSRWQLEHSVIVEHFFEILAVGEEAEELEAGHFELIDQRL